MKTFNFSILTILTILFLTTSCAENPKELILTPASTTLKGDLSDYYEIVEKEYKVATNSFGYSITVELKRNNTPFAFDANDVDPFGKSSGKNGNVGFGIETFNEQGDPLYIYQATAGGMYDDTEALIKLKNGESGFIFMGLTFDENGAKTAKTFKISSALEIDKESNSALSNETTTDTSSTNNNDWDAVIADYGTFIDKYIVLLKKAQQGDASAITDYTQYIEKATSLAQKLETARSEMTTEQISRFVKLQEKLISAASSL